jgi:predicted nicotinamide N-methyase
MIQLYLDKYATLAPDPFSPEIQMYNTAHLSDLWSELQKLTNNPEADIPYWAVVWPGGRALACYILNNRETFRDKRVLDIGCGSGIASIACSMAGATVTGMDTDPLAIEIAELTARVNRADCKFLVQNPFAAPDPSALISEYDLIIAGDVFYIEGFANESLRFLRLADSSGKIAIAADAGRTYRPGEGVQILASYRIPVFKEIEGIQVRDGHILRILADSLG